MHDMALALARHMPVKGPQEKRRQRHQRLIRLGPVLGSPKASLSAAPSPLAPRSQRCCEAHIFHPSITLWPCDSLSTTTYPQSLYLRPSALSCLRLFERSSSCSLPPRTRIRSFRCAPSFNASACTLTSGTEIFCCYLPYQPVTHLAKLVAGPWRARSLPVVFSRFAAAHRR